MNIFFSHFLIYIIIIILLLLFTFILVPIVWRLTLVLCDRHIIAASVSRAKGSLKLITKNNNTMIDARA